jgi:hypothetical protein
MKDRAEVIWCNQCSGNERELIAQFDAVRQLNPRVSKPVLHITLSLAPGDGLTKDKLIEMCEQCAKELGFEKNQWVAVHHRDTGHQHLHIVVNRIGFDGKTVSDSNNYQRLAAYCRKMEMKYTLRQVSSPRRFLSQEQKLLPRFDQRKAQIRQHVGECVAVSRSYEEFERLMKEKKYEVLKGRGIAFRDEKKVYVKGSDLGYSLQTIELLLEQNKNHIEKTISPRVKRGEKEQKTAQKVAALSAYEKKAALQKGNGSLGNSVAKEAAKVLNDLLKPEQNSDQLPQELTHKQKKKRRGLHH